MLQRQRDEEAHHRFVIRPLPVPTSTIEPRFQLLQDKNKRRSESIKRDSLEKLKASQVCVCFALFSLLFALHHNVVYALTRSFFFLTLH